MICLVGERGPAPVRVRHDNGERIMRDGPMLSCEGLAEEPASAYGAVTDCLPPAFTDCLLDSALEPVLDAAAKRGAQDAKRKKKDEATEVAKALLTVTVCDPACGSGSLLVAAARRIARRVAVAREGNQSPDALRRAMREVVSSCVYGVDVSGEAVERAKDRLRIAADVPGMTLPFLDGHVRQGNALIGASPEQIESGVPDEAFRRPTATTADMPAPCAAPTPSRTRDRPPCSASRAATPTPTRHWRSPWGRSGGWQAGRRPMTATRRPST